MRRTCPTCHIDWLELPSLTIGGGSGDYFIDCPVTSHDEVQYRVTALANFDTGTTASVVTSGLIAPLTPPTSTQTTINATNALQGVVYGVPPSAHATIRPTYEHFLNDARRVFIRIDTAGTGQVYVSIQFRLHSHMTGKPRPVPYVTDPNLEDTMHHQREQDALKAIGYIGDPQKVPI